MFEDLNERVKNLTFTDIRLIKLSVFFFTVIIVKVFPVLLKIDYPILVTLVGLCAIKPLYDFWIKK